MTVTTASPARSLILDYIEVCGVERLSPTFLRVEFGGVDGSLEQFGVAGTLRDQRCKLIFPGASGRVPALPETDDWYAEWAARSAAERGHVRTYTIAEVRGAGAAPRVVVDFVSPVGPLAHAGPGASWAARAVAGDRLILLAPRRGVEFGGVEFLPPSYERLLVVGDETALPAIAGILRDLPADACGAAYVEVPDAGDVRPLACPPGVAVRWLLRRGTRGELLQRAVMEHLGACEQSPVMVSAAAEVDPDLWETPTWSSSGESLAAAGPSGSAYSGLYAWIAGEAGVVTGLRRALVRELGIDRRQVAFMGYWRDGVAARS